MVKSNSYVPPLAEPGTGIEILNGAVLATHGGTVRPLDTKDIFSITSWKDEDGFRTVLSFASGREPMALSQGYAEANRVWTEAKRAG